jgi:intracellular septation protein
MTDDTDKPTGTRPPEPEFNSKQLIKLLVELGPLLVFFICNAKFDIYFGTGAFIVATIAALAASKILFGNIPVMLLVSAALVTIFGGLTIWLHDERFIKVKPTIIYSMSALTLFGGLYFNQSLFKHVLGETLKLTDEGWRKLTVRWAVFFLVLAVLNEVVWRSVSTDTWVSFKLFGIFPLTMIFAISQAGLMKRHELS